MFRDAYSSFSMAVQTYGERTTESGNRVGLHAQHREFDSNDPLLEYMPRIKHDSHVSVVLC